MHCLLSLYDADASMAGGHRSSSHDSLCWPDLSMPSAATRHRPLDCAAVHPDVCGDSETRVWAVVFTLRPHVSRLHTCLSCKVCDSLHFMHYLILHDTCAMTPPLNDFHFCAAPVLRGRSRKARLWAGSHKLKIYSSRCQCLFVRLND